MIRNALTDTEWAGLIRSRPELPAALAAPAPGSPAPPPPAP
ncbi:hypothetical protein ACFWNK_38415 [Streptomyces sp. NPDC058417]